MSAYDGVYLYRRGTWERKFVFREREKYYFTVTPGGRAAIYKYRYATDVKIYLSDDCGETWREEPLKLATEHYTPLSTQPRPFTFRLERICLAISLRFRSTLRDRFLVLERD